MNNEWIDISIPLHNGMPYWPDNPPVRIDRTMDLDRGDEATVSSISIGSHTGTHMDAPSHFIRSAAAMDQMPLSATIGMAQVIEIRDPVAIAVEELRQHTIRAGDRVLFKTRNSAREWAKRAFMEDFVYLTTEGALWLVERGVRTVGVDYLSVGGYQKNGPEVHQVLLKNQVWIIEGLDLSGVGTGFYDLICLPLKILHGDGAPARAVVRRRDGAPPHSDEIKLEVLAEEN
jgi:arylformamidase